MELGYQVIAAAETIRAEAQEGLTLKALARGAARQVGRPLPLAQVTGALRALPQHFVEGVTLAGGCASVATFLHTMRASRPASPVPARVPRYAGAVTPS